MKDNSSEKIFISAFIAFTGTIVFWLFYAGLYYLLEAYVDKLG